MLVIIIYIFCRYQTQYKLAARPAKPPGKIKRGTSRTEYVSSTLPSSERSLPSSEQSLDARALVGNINLREIAETPGRYHGGFQCRDSVFDMNVEVLEQRLKITCKCKWNTRTSPYRYLSITDNFVLVLIKFSNVFKKQPV